MQDTRCLLLAGGLGTRLKPITDDLPKCLVPLAGRPLLDYWIASLGRAGVKTGRINTHHHPDVVRGYLRELKQRGEIDLTESHEPVLLGSAGTIHANPDLAVGASEIIVIYTDNLSAVDLSEMLRHHRTHGKGFTMLLFHAANPEACGIASLDSGGTVTAFVEKPEHPISDLANAGVYILSPAIYTEVADMAAFDIGFDVLPRFVGRMSGFVCEGYHRDIGTIEALEQAEKDLKSGEISFGGPATC